MRELRGKGRELREICIERHGSNRFTVWAGRFRAGFYLTFVDSSCFLLSDCLTFHAEKWRISSSIPNSETERQPLRIGVSYRDALQELVSQSREGTIEITSQ